MSLHRPMLTLHSPDAPFSTCLSPQFTISTKTVCLPFLLNFAVLPQGLSRVDVPQNLWRKSSSCRWKQTEGYLRLACDRVGLRGRRTS